MLKAKNDHEEMLPLTPAVFHVLLALADGERHGVCAVGGAQL